MVTYMHILRHFWTRTQHADKESAMYRHTADQLCNTIRLPLSHLSSPWLSHCLLPPSPPHSNTLPPSPPHSNTLPPSPPHSNTLPPSPPHSNTLPPSPPHSNTLPPSPPHSNTLPPSPPHSNTLPPSLPCRHPVSFSNSTPTIRATTLGDRLWQSRPTAHLRDYHSQTLWTGEPKELSLPSRTRLSWHTGFLQVCFFTFHARHTWV